MGHTFMFIPNFKLFIRRTLEVFYCPKANGGACVNFGCTRAIDGVVLKSTQLLVGVSSQNMNMGYDSFFWVVTGLFVSEVSYHYEM
jgi:hypothetical protein